ncbi:NACHT domain-containing protein [Mycena sanguinolenta]|uniref:NACHT domain-containing protein n=1 Tax=Mycena sanguinolenta TaxID=230812 RepID=A0A8H6Z8B2_9AGAR|nr:NACHT domain-containing protein [Mycena sanguinolenta]
MPADRRSKFSNTRASGRRTVNYISGGRGGAGGNGHGNGTGGAGGNGMGPHLSFDMSVGHFIMHNNLHLDDPLEADRQNAFGSEVRHQAASGPYIYQNIHHHGDRGIDILHRAVALEAIHDSAESFPQPRCHPDTRTKMLKDLRGWALDGIDSESDMDSESDVQSESEFSTFRSAGKSAIMQTLARQLRDAGRLGGSFFFKRGHATRGNARTLFATVAFQLALTVPRLRSSISQIVETDPSLIQRSIETQMNKLISEPYRYYDNCAHVTILIDGLDECEDHGVQQEILRAIRNSNSNHPIPLRFIISSRPEPHIHEIFVSPVYNGDYRSLNVEQSFNDIQRYLRDEFARIHREHCTMVSVPHPWPSPDLLDDLVDKSSGHFIYAATIIKFIDDRSYRPTQRLGIVLDENRAGSASAFDPLDRLYMNILSSAPRQAELLPILCAIVNFALTLDEVDQLFELPEGEAQLILRGLHSVLKVLSDKPSTFISSHHASFLEFLNNPSRSHQFCVSGDGPVERWIPRAGRPLYLELIPFLISLSPSAEVCLLIARMDPGWIFRQHSATIESMLSWLNRIPSAPQDLIALWEDYVFMSSMGDYRTAWTVKHILLPSCELCRVLAAMVFFNLAVWALPDVLDITWTEFRTILCSLRPNIAIDGEQVLHGSGRHVIRALVPPELREATFRDLALSCIRGVIKRHIHDGVNDKDAWLVPSCKTDNLLTI